MGVDRVDRAGRFDRRTFLASLVVLIPRSNKSSAEVSHQAPQPQGVEIIPVGSRAFRLTRAEGGVGTDFIREGLKHLEEKGCSAPPPYTVVGWDSERTAREIIVGTNSDCYRP